MKFKILQYTALSVLFTSSVANSFTRDEILKNPSAVAKYVASFVDKGYACINREYDESYINVVKFSTDLKKFPYLSTANSSMIKLESVSTNKGFNTLIVNREFGTEIASLSGQSIIGKSEDANSYIAAGYFKDLEYYPNYNKLDQGSINFDRQSLFKEGEAFITGLVIDKKNGSMRARIYQNQADPGQRQKYNVNDVEYDCTEVSGNLEQFAFKNIISLIDDMKDTEDRLQKLNNLKKQKKEQEVAAHREQINSEKEQETAFNVAKLEKNKESDFTTDKIMNDPSLYADAKVMETAFSLKCVDAFKNTYSIVAFNGKMDGYPILKYTHNERSLIENNKYSINNLVVKTSIDGYDAGHNGEEYKDTKNFILKFDKNIAGETFDAGQYIVGNIVSSEDNYVGSNINQLRDGKRMPELLRSRNKKQEVIQADVIFEGIKIDRKTLETVVRMNIQGNNHRDFNYSCHVSGTPEVDARELLVGGVEAIKKERDRIGVYAKNEVKNRI